MSCSITWSRDLSWLDFKCIVVEIFKKITYLCGIYLKKVKKEKYQKYQKRIQD